MRPIIKIAILAFLLKYSVAGQKGLSLYRKEVSDVDWLTEIDSDWVSVQTAESINSDFTYFTI
jgi:hypothetical protein